MHFSEPSSGDVHHQFRGGQGSPPPDLLSFTKCSKSALPTSLANLRLNMSLAKKARGDYAGQTVFQECPWGLPLSTHGWLSNRSWHRVLGNASPQALSFSPSACDHDSGCPRPVHISQRQAWWADRGGEPRKGCLESALRWGTWQDHDLDP